MAMDGNPPQPTARSLIAPPGVAPQSRPDVQQAGEQLETLRATVRRIGARQLAVGARRDGVRRNQRTVWLAGGAPTTSEIDADADAQPKPDLAAAGMPARFFAVSEGIPANARLKAPRRSWARLIRIARICLLSADYRADSKKPDLVSRALCLIPWWVG